MDRLWKKKTRRGDDSVKPQNHPRSQKLQQQDQEKDADNMVDLLLLDYFSFSLLSGNQGEQYSIQQLRRHYAAILFSDSESEDGAEEKEETD